MRPHRATLLRPSSVGLRIRKPGLPMPAAEWFEFSSFSPSAGIRSQIQEIRRKAKLALIKEVALASGRRPIHRPSLLAGRQPGAPRGISQGNAGTGLTTSSNFVGNSAGTSLGFEPRNTLAMIGAL